MSRDGQEPWLLLTLLARTRQVALFIHMRGKHDVGLEDFHEVFTNAAVTGTPEPATTNAADPGAFAVLNLPRP